MKRATNLKDRVVDVEYQHKLELWVNGQYICTYKADFKVTYADNRVEYHETKGVKTADYVIKAKLVKACLGITIKEM